MTEEWRDIDGFEGLYQVSDLGRVRNAKTGYVLRTWLLKGYAQVSLGRGNKMAVHRLVLKAFTPEPFDGVEVNHKNGNRDDNCLGNLEWVTRSENISHAHRSLPRKLHAWSRGVVVTAPDGTVSSYPTQCRAAEALGANVSNFSKALRKGYKVFGHEVSYV